MSWKGVEFPIAVLFLAGFGGCLLLQGCIWLFFLFTSNQELARLEQLPVVSAAGLRDSTTGREVLIEGRIDERSPVAESGLVAYHVEQLRENSDGDLEWRTTETIAPPLLVLLADGPVQVSGDYSLRNPPAEVTMSSDLRHTGFPVHTPLIAIGMIVDGLEGQNFGPSLSPRAPAPILSRKHRRLRCRAHGSVASCQASVCCCWQLALLC
ncbi:MAG: hypothetical protein HC893_02805 [Chloroflexaceae bacterium]|nr:hypothetical protein [Chloroflexaceae bacterium]